MSRPDQPPALTLADFDFDLPPELIAQAPSAERSASRLLDGRSAGGSAGGIAGGSAHGGAGGGAGSGAGGSADSEAAPVDRIFRDLPGLLNPGDLLVFNDTRVIKARLLGHKASGGAVEILVERIVAPTEVWAHLRASKSPRAGGRLRIADAFDAEVIGRCGPQLSLFHLRFDGDVLLLLDAHGHVPLPPYITHADSADDAARYQTVFAERPGAVAAPTASLHFDAAVLAALQSRGVGSARVTLHVGAGTFQPVRVANINEHVMHSEWFEVNADAVAAIDRTRAAGGRIVAAGTTTLRALESAARGGVLLPTVGDTDIFITPGFEFRVVDRLVTNFHLPRSTLLMLVSAFAGHSRMLQLYRHAIEQRYRFFSYGDAMLLDRVGRCAA